MLTLIGDVHGKFDKYLKIISRCDYSLQLGDFGFEYSILDKIDAHYHKVLKGNHDSYDDNSWPHFLGDYGYTEHGGIKFFFLRGAFSLDREMRLIKERTGEWPKTWWDQEELSFVRLYDAIDLYKQIKPDILISHDCPTIISKQIGNPRVLKKFGFDPDRFDTRTQLALDTMMEAHAPKYHYFGHYHTSKTVQYNGTIYRCLNELEYIDL